MGGGVGGMVYSLKHEAGNVKLVASHSNHRGDIIARSDEDGSLTSFALYEAYGTRPYEWGSDPDRQKANTKEEEKDLGLLNEGMRYRDLDTGTFLTRDPMGYADGPNIYCYVHCNPITQFDALGLGPWSDMVDKAVDDAKTYWEGKADNAVEAVGVGILSMGMEVLGGTLTLGEKLAEGVGSWVGESIADPSRIVSESTPILGPVATQAGTAIGNLAADPKNPENIRQGVVAACQVTTTCLGGVQLSRMAGVPGTKGNTTPASAPSETQPSLTTSATDVSKTTGGRLGSETTRAHVADVATEMESRGWEITGGGGRLPEEYLPGPGGARTGSSFPDITATKNGQTLRVNTIDTRANGITPTTREAANAARIRAQTGEHLLLVPKPKP